MTILKDNRAHKTFSYRQTRWAERLLPFQFKVVHAAGRTMGMAVYISRHPSPSNSNELKIKAEEFWNNWLTKNELTIWKTVSEKLPQQSIPEQPIKSKLAKKSKTQERVKATDEAESANANKQTIKEVVATIKVSVTSDSMQESGDQAKMSNSKPEAANQPPIKVPICYSISQIEVSQTLGNYAFARQYKTDDFLGKTIKLIKRQTSQNIAGYQRLGGRNSAV